MIDNIDTYNVKVDDEGIVTITTPHGNINVIVNATLTPPKIIITIPQDKISTPKVESKKFPEGDTVQIIYTYDPVVIPPRHFKTIRSIFDHIAIKAHILK